MTTSKNATTKRTVNQITKSLIPEKVTNEKVIEKSKKTLSDIEILKKKLSSKNIEDYTKKTERNTRKWSISFLETIRKESNKNENKSSNSIRNIAKDRLLTQSKAIIFEFAKSSYNLDKLFKSEVFKMYLSFIKLAFDNLDARPNYTGDSRKAKAEKIAESYTLLAEYNKIKK